MTPIMKYPAGIVPNTKTALTQLTNNLLLTADSVLILLPSTFDMYDIL